MYSLRITSLRGRVAISHTVIVMYAIRTLLFDIPLGAKDPNFTYLVRLKKVKIEDEIGPYYGRTTQNGTS